MGLWGGAIGTVSGLVGSRKNKKLASKAEADANALEANRPRYEINREYSENADAYGRASKTSELAGQALMEQKIEQNAASALGAASRTGASGGMLAQLALSGLQSTNDSINDLNIAGAGARQVNIDKLATAKEKIAEEKDKAFNFNINDPYQNKVARARGKQKSYTDRMYQQKDLALGSGIKAADSAEENAMKLAEAAMKAAV